MSKNLFIISLLQIVFISCRERENTPEKEVSIITGTVNIPVDDDITLPPVSFLPDIESLRTPESAGPVTMVAFGGSIFAGFRDGGLYRKGQLTSIPAMIAHQMQLESFVSPLFDKEDGNGTGYLVYDKSSSLPSWKRVENNLGIIFQNPFTLEKYTGEEVHNISWPQGPGSTSDSTNAVYRFPDRRKYYSYLYRFYDKRGVSDRPFEVLTGSKKIDLVLFCDDLDTWIGMASYSVNLGSNIQSMLHEGYFYSKRQFIIDNLSRGRKLVLFNYPNFLEFPYFNLYKVKDLKLKGNISSSSLEDGALLMPTDNIKKIFLAKKEVPFTMEDRDFLSQNEVNTVLIGVLEQLNQNTFGEFSKQYDLPLVDLFSLYKKVLSKQYFSDDGVFIDPSFPDGNFFSEDGIHPSIVGNAVIANEAIKEINRKYKTKIPLIAIRQLINSIQ
jgi:hypothetical protein